MQYNLLALFPKLTHEVLCKVCFSKTSVYESVIVLFSNRNQWCALNDRKVFVLLLCVQKILD